MKNKNLADNLAKKAFDSAKVQESWEIHIQHFGPILTPAFENDYQTRVHLAAALNLISRREVKKGLEKLQSIQDKCINDADKAAWLFCMGLGFEMAGAREKMIEYYMLSGKYNHRFYLPYLKVAKNAYIDGKFDIAEENYMKGIKCLQEDEVSVQNDLLLASSYSNLAACQVMVHRYEEAKSSLETSKQFRQHLEGRNATEAILYAAMGSKEKATEYLKKLKTESQDLYTVTKMTVDEILNGTHEQFKH